MRPPLPVPDPTTSRLGDSAMASASRSRRPSSVCSMEDMCRSPKPSGQLPHTSSRVTLRSKVPAAHRGHPTLSPCFERAARSSVYPPPALPTPPAPRGVPSSASPGWTRDTPPRHPGGRQNEAARATGSDRVGFQKKDLRSRSRAEHLLARFNPNTSTFLSLRQ